MEPEEPRELREPGPGAETAAAPRWEEAKTFYDNLTSKKKPKSVKAGHGYGGGQGEGHRGRELGEGLSWRISSPIQALEAVNKRLRELYPESEDLFDIVLVTNNHAQVGVRLINSINHYDLFIERFCMTGGNSPICYLKAYHTNLYLSADAEKVQEAIDEGIAAATIFSPSRDVAVSQSQLRVAFDGDAVLFSDESERIVKAHGLDSFFEHEKAHENKPLAQGPLKGFLEALGRLQKKFYSKGLRLECPIRTYLVTARSAASSGARALKTLRSWGLETDEALFLAGAPKGPLLEKIRPHIFFDDQMFHVAGAQEMGTVAAHVPYGVAQTPRRTTPTKQAPSAQ
uniref:Cytosolic 5'-nucleotidase 1A n=1 Tax=Sus scrofa TaxID=9823 RepID=A0A8D1I6T1_PIG